MLLLNTWLFGNFYFAIDDSNPLWTLINNNNNNIDDNDEIVQNFHSNFNHHNMDLIYPLGVFDNSTTTTTTTTIITTE